MARRALRRFRAPLPQLLRGLLVVWAAALLLGCAAIQHAYETSKVSGRPLSARGTEGAKRLEAESQLDPTVRTYLLENGRPEILYVVSRSELYFFYVERDRAVRFVRELESSEAMEFGRIPAHLLDMLPAASKRSIVARREAQNRRTRARAPRRTTASAPPPAARQSEGEAYLVGFDVTEIVERMRPPLTAADAGVTGWRRSELRDGTARWTAKVRNTRYEVRNDRVAMTTDIPRKRTGVPTAARLALSRINAAVFGTRAGPVNDTTLALAERVARDPSGRTHFARRIAGRTIRISRHPRKGLFVYTVQP